MSFKNDDRDYAGGDEDSDDLGEDEGSHRGQPSALRKGDDHDDEDGDDVDKDDYKRAHGGGYYQCLRRMMKMINGKCSSDGGLFWEFSLYDLLGTLACTSHSLIEL